MKRRLVLPEKSMTLSVVNDMRFDGSVLGEICRIGLEKLTCKADHGTERLRPFYLVHGDFFFINFHRVGGKKAVTSKFFNDGVCFCFGKAKLFGEKIGREGFVGFSPHQINDCFKEKQNY